MLGKKQLERMVGCAGKEGCADCASEAAKTALAYREMLERARKTLQDAWDDDGSAVIGNQILETINVIDALIGGEKDA